MRIFPRPDKDTLSSFAYHSTRLERIPVATSEISGTLNNTKVNLYLQGQFTAINYILEIAGNPDLIPKETRDHRQSLEQIKFLRIAHLNLLNPVAAERDKTQNFALPDPLELGKWRQGPFFHLGKEYPNPIILQYKLHDWWQEIIGFHNSFRAKIETPGSLDDSDIAALTKMAHEAHLKLYTIKPFQDGSHQIARLTENLFRLNWGLPWRIFRHEDEFKLPYVEEARQFFAPQE